MSDTSKVDKVLERLLILTLVGIGFGTIVGAVATESFIQRERRRIESNPRYVYNDPIRTPVDVGIGGCLGALAGTLVGKLLLSMTRGRMWLVMLLVGIGVGATVGYLAGFTLPMPLIGMQRKVPFAMGGLVGGGLGPCCTLLFSDWVTWRSRTAQNTAVSTGLADSDKPTVEFGSKTKL